MSSLMQLMRRNRWFMLTVVLPTVLSALYYGLVASDQFVSESRFVIKAPNQRSAQISTLANLVQTTGLSAGQEQANEVIDYIRSRSALQGLTATVPLEKLYTGDHVDLLSRYPVAWQERGEETLFRYYRKMIDVDIDHDSGLVVLKAKGYRARDAHDINERLLDLSERLVNDLNTRAHVKELSEAEGRVTLAQERVERARAAMRVYRNDQKLLDPGKEASGVIEVANKLVSERASVSAQLSQMQQAAPSNPAIPALRERLAAISREIGAQSGRAVGTDQGIATKLTGYEKLLAEQEFAGQNLAAANTFLEQARQEAIRQQFYLERVVAPNTPDMPELPRRLRIIITVLAATLCLYFIAWMFIVGILEHAPED